MAQNNISQLYCAFHAENALKCFDYYIHKNLLIHHWNAATSRLETSSVFNNLGKIEQNIPLKWGSKLSR